MEGNPSAGRHITMFIEPTQLWPRDTGTLANIAMTNGRDAQRVNILRISHGITAAHSLFPPERDHIADIRRPEDQIIFVINLSGSMTLAPQNKVATHTIKRGQIWAYRPGVRPLHRVVSQETGCTNIVFTLCPENLPRQMSLCLEESFSQSGRFYRLHLSTPAQYALGSLFDTGGSSRSMIRKEGQCHALIGHVLEEIDAKRFTSYSSDRSTLVSQARAYMAEHLSERLSLSQISYELNVSHVTLTKAFREETGMTVFDCLRQMRFEQAVCLITHTDRSLAEISYDCGYSSPAHLSTRFREHFGMAARSWRQSRT
ncbi:helix-turn-helix domain-containing protein [Celeribacter persicus]|nr:AraC family transcriptional regulator [Celeribacter persicus]